MGRFPRTFPPPSISGNNYQRFRPAVRSDFERCCAYCYLHEEHLGGQRHFELDHFCPRRFCPERTEDFYNLYWSCHACNGPMGKHSHWPSDEVRALGYDFVNLCEDFFEDHFEIRADGSLKPLTKKAEYTIRHIGLNHEDLNRLRARLLQEERRMDTGYFVPVPDSSDT
jgi:hypothetical protein